MGLFFREDLIKAQLFLKKELNALRNTKWNLLAFDSSDQIRTPNWGNAMFSKSTWQTDRRRDEAVDPRD